MPENVHVTILSAKGRGILFHLLVTASRQEENSMDEKKLNNEEMKQVAGGLGNEYGVRCPKCGSDNVKLEYTHDEIGVFDCKACGNHFTEGPY